jgi:hypothetical protein
VGAAPPRMSASVGMLCSLVVVVVGVRSGV